ncbi:CPBP family glutamic-type intramembrane protease [Streptomyces sp. CA-250714]|uniref:CPBP family glutamic-type intramembrane protease n=1 Tax=Streptomyces sp. CA-250714 TaxID=3240060 RepID=UPI003D91AC20
MTELRLARYSGEQRAEPGGRSQALRRALGGGAAMALALGIGTGAGPTLARALGVGPSGTAAKLVPAALVSAVALALVLGAVRRSGHGPARLGFGGPAASLRALLAGVAVTGAAACAVFGLGTAAGLLRWSSPDPAALATFLVTNAAVALLLEALPEETTLRGYTWTSLRGAFGGTATALGTTAVFLLVPGTSTVVEAVTARLLGEQGTHVGLVPEGQHPVDYLILLTLFGLTLVAARTALREAPLWAAIGTHLTFLTVNRIVLEGDRRDAGWSTVHQDPAAPLLVPLYLLVAAGAFVVLRRVSSRVRRG